MFAFSLCNAWQFVGWLFSNWRRWRWFGQTRFFQSCAYYSHVPNSRCILSSQPSSWTWAWISEIWSCDKAQLGLSRSAQQKTFSLGPTRPVHTHQLDSSRLRVPAFLFFSPSVNWANLGYGTTKRKSLVKKIITIKSEQKHTEPWKSERATERGDKGTAIPYSSPTQWWNLHPTPTSV